MQDGTLDHTLKTERRLGVDVVLAGNRRRMFGDEGAQVIAQLLDAGTARPQRLGRRGVIEQGQEQVLDRDELMALLPSLNKGHVQADFEFLGNHQFSSITQASGCWFSRAKAATCSTLVAAMSRG